jgi:hypothetical protein
MRRLSTVRPSKAMAASIVIPSVLPLPRAFRPDAERLSSSDRGELRIGFKVSAAFRAELRSVPGHADGDTVDIRNLRAANAKRVSAARLLLLLRVSLTCRGPHEYRERRAHHQSEMDLSGANKHCESPECFRRIVSEGRRNGKKDRACHRNTSWKSARSGSIFHRCCVWVRCSCRNRSCPEGNLKVGRLAAIASSFHSIPMPGNRECEAIHREFHRSFCKTGSAQSCHSSQSAVSVMRMMWAATSGQICLDIGTPAARARADALSPSG